MACGLSRPIPRWGRSLDQGRSTEAGDTTEVREGSLYKSKGDQQYEQMFRQRIHHGNNDILNNVILFCAQRNRGYSFSVKCHCKHTEGLPVGSKMYVAINGHFAL